MKTPNYTDMARYPNGYVRAEQTDVGKTFARARAAMEAQGIIPNVVRLKLPKLKVIK